MKLFGKNLEEEVAVIAEIGVNHEGDLQAAHRLIKAAAAAGADAVKLQTYSPERFISTLDEERFDRVTKFCLDKAAHIQLYQTARDCGIVLFSTAVTEDVVPFLAEMFPVIKIASGDLDFRPVIQEALRTDRQIIISTGNGSLEDIDRLISWCHEEVGNSFQDRLILMHCVSAYPAPIEQANIRSIPFLREKYGLTIGYSNHVIEPEAVFAAVALGASVVEVHFTETRHGRTFRDHALSYEPSELASLISSIHRIKVSLGQADKEPQECEKGLRWAIRKGVVASRDLAKGSKLTDADLFYARPATEFRACERTGLIGRTLKQPLKKGQTVPRSSVE